MKVYECKGCGHIEFNEAPEKCLVCRAPKASYVEKPDAIKTPANPAALTDGDKKHIPKIVVVKECGLIPNAGCTDVHVKVGEIQHVMQKEHFIRFIDYYLNHKFISRVWLSPESCYPAAALHMNATSGTVQAIENCNVHGNWMSEATI
jgi:desulfoferrodoxin-like iron-binding protein